MQRGVTSIGPNSKIPRIRWTRSRLMLDQRKVPANHLATASGKIRRIGRGSRCQASVHVASVATAFGQGLSAATCRNGGDAGFREQDPASYSYGVCRTDRSRPAGGFATAAELEVAQFQSASERVQPCDPPQRHRSSVASPPIPRYPGLHQEAAPRWAALSANARAGDPVLVVPAADRARYEVSFARLASVFPDTFYVSERGRYFPDDSDDKGRF
jgi:hypothetical protein